MDDKYMNRSGRYSLSKRAVRAFAELHGIDLCHTANSLFRVFNPLPENANEVRKPVQEDDDDFMIFTEEVCHHGDRLCRVHDSDHFRATSDLTFPSDLQPNDKCWNTLMFRKRIAHAWKDESPRIHVVWSIFK